MAQLGPKEAPPVETRERVQVCSHLFPSSNASHNKPLRDQAENLFRILGEKMTILCLCTLVHRVILRPW
jgi:hypothetical protein